MDSLPSKKAKQVRNWVELPPDILSMIFTNLGAVEILRGPRRVCSVWRKLSEEPHLFRIIDLRNLPYSYVQDRRMERLATLALDKSDGQLLEFSIDSQPTETIFRSIMQKSSLLRCFRIAYGFEKVEKVLIEMAKKLPQLEELEICFCGFTTDVIEAFGSSCLQLKSFRLNRVGYKGYPSKDCEDEALAIAKNMPELRYLHIFGNLLTDIGLRAILDGCPHLKTLDLRQCFNVYFMGDLKKRCEDGNIKLRLPDDSTDDYEFDPRYDDDSYLYNDCGLTSDSDDDINPARMSHFEYCSYL